MSKATKVKDYILSNKTGTNSILTGEAITDGELEMADVAVSDDEEVLLVVKTWGVIGEKAAELTKKVSFGKIGSMLGKALQSTRMGTFVITDKKVYWARLRPDTATAGVTGIVGKINGNCALDKLLQAAIGEHDHCFGSAYVGHQLLINGKVVGLLRMGEGLEYDEKAIEYLNALFNSCINISQG